MNQLLIRESLCINQDTTQQHSSAVGSPLTVSPWRALLMMTRLATSSARQPLYDGGDGYWRLRLIKVTRHSLFVCKNSHLETQRLYSVVQLHGSEHGRGRASRSHCHSCITACRGEVCGHTAASLVPMVGTVLHVWGAAQEGTCAAAGISAAAEHGAAAVR